MVHHPLYYSIYISDSGSWLRQLALYPRIGDNLPFLEALLLSAYIKDSIGEAQACIIWMHGLGANYQDMAGVAAELNIALPVRHLFIDAPVRPVTINNHMRMQAWYDLRGFDFARDEDREGILESEQNIRQIIHEQLATGLQPHQLYLAGFSQGGAMALFTGLRTKERLGGILALSSGIPLYSECTLSLDHQTPIFFACGQHDPIVLPAWSKASYEWLKANQYQDITWHEYPMEHSICRQEITDISNWLHTQITRSNEKETRT
jgi:phospholipase/carboxylesterase